VHAHTRARAQIYRRARLRVHADSLSKPLHPLTRRATLRRRRRRRCRRVLRLSVPNIHTDTVGARARERASNIVNLYVFEFQEGEQNHPNIFTRGNRMYSRGKTRGCRRWQEFASRRVSIRRGYRYVDLSRMNGARFLSCVVCVASCNATDAF